MKGISQTWARRAARNQQASGAPTHARRSRHRAAARRIVLVWLLSLPLGLMAGALTPIADPTPSALAGQTLDGEPWQLADQRGHVVLIHFWAGWCTPCLEELPALNRLQARLRGQPFVLIGVNVGEPAPRVRTLVRQLGIGFPILLDPDSAIFARWGATVLPTSLVLDGEGRPRLVKQGPLDWDDAEPRKALYDLIQE